VKFRNSALLSTYKMSTYSVALVFVSTLILSEQYKLQALVFVESVHTAERSASFSDNKVFWRVCSRYFVSNSMILAVTLQTRTYEVNDISSVLLQEMHSHLATPLTITGRIKSSVELLPKKQISLRQILSNESTNDLTSKHQYGTSIGLSTNSCVYRVYRSRERGTGMNTSPYRTKSNPTADERAAEHKTTDQPMRKAKHKSAQHIVNSRQNELLQTTNIPICSYPLAEHNTNTTDISRCYQPVYSKVTQFDRTRSIYFSCDNYLIIAENENSVIGYFIYLTQINISWNSEMKFIILLRVEVGYDSTNEFKVRCRSLLQRLWEEFKVTNIIVMTASVVQSRYVISENVTVFNPFLPTRGTVQRGKIFTLNGSTSEIPRWYSVPNFYGYPLRVVAFYRFPTAVSTAKCHLVDKNCTITYTGMDASLLYTLANYLNFTPVIRLPSDGQQYGQETKNSTFTGAIGDIVHGRADITMNSMFIKIYGSDKVLFTHSAYSDKVCVVVPKAKRIPKWLTIPRRVDSTVALCVLGLYIINACFYFLINQARSSFESNLSKSKTGWSEILIEMFRPFVSSPVPRIPTSVSQRVFFGSCIVFCFVLTSAVQSILVTAITMPYYYADINTLEKLDASGLSIYTKAPSLMDTFGPAQINSTVSTFEITSILDRLSRRVKVAVNRINLWNAASTERNIALLARTDEEHVHDLDKYRATDGSFLLHTVRECPRQYLLGYLVPRGSPYLPYINKGIDRLVEAGIVQHWRNIMPPNTNGHNGFNITNLTEIAKVNTKNPKVFSLKDLQLAFYILAVGLSGSVIIFLLEMLSMKKKKATDEWV
jgi:Ligand-gated ion channel.